MYEFRFYLNYQDILSKTTSSYMSKKWDLDSSFLIPVVNLLGEI